MILSNFDVWQLFENNTASQRPFFILLNSDNDITIGHRYNKKKLVGNDKQVIFISKKLR